MDRLQDLTVGYGYRPLRATVWLVALLAIGTTSFGLHHPPPSVAGQGQAYNPFVYTLDLLLPIVEFGSFAPTGAQQWLAYGLIAAGWILATTVAAGVARTLTRQ